MRKKVTYCEYCGGKTSGNRICGNCNDKLKLYRSIRSMLLPYKIAKDRRKENGK